MVKDTGNILYSQLISVYCLVNILENRGKMVEMVLELEEGMNVLAGRLNETPECLFSLFIHDLLQPVNLAG